MERAARENGMGLWRDIDAVHPKTWRMNKGLR
jgi:hypothetical protein